MSVEALERDPDFPAAAPGTSQRAHMRAWVRLQGHRPSLDEAWGPRLAWWVDFPWVMLRGLIAGALAIVARAAPCHKVALFRVLSDAWPSSRRRGKPVERCVACGRLAPDRFPHVLLYGLQDAQRQELAHLDNVADAMGFLPGEYRDRRRSASHILNPRMAALTITTDVYPKMVSLRARCHPDRWNTHRRDRALRSAARFAIRRLGDM